MMWIAASLIAALAQTGRNAAQAGLTGRLGTVGATGVRFLFGLPFVLIFLAVLQTVPDDLYEAARIDGAGPWGRFRHVTLPAIAPTMLLVSIISVAGFFQLFAEPYVMTQGGPAQSTVTVLYFMYEEGFKWWNLGSASAVAFVLFLCILAVTLVQLAVARRMERGR